MLYRIFTEDTGRDDHIRQVLDKRLDGYTIIKGTGYWQGTAEDSVLIEVVLPSDYEYKEMVMEIAADIRKVNHQECVLVQRIENREWFVGE